MGKFSNVMGTLYNYFNQFLPAYIEGQIPDKVDGKKVEPPYITYSVSYANEYEDNLIQCRIWTKSDTTFEVRKYADMIADNVGNGTLFKCKEGGQVWIKTGSPFMQIVPDEDETIKSVYINLITNFLI